MAEEWVHIQVAWKITCKPETKLVLKPRVQLVRLQTYLSVTFSFSLSIAFIKKRKIFRRKVRKDWSDKDAFYNYLRLRIRSCFVANPNSLISTWNCYWTIFKSFHVKRIWTGLFLFLKYINYKYYMNTTSFLFSLIRICRYFSLLLLIYSQVYKIRYLSNYVTEIWSTHKHS